MNQDHLYQSAGFELANPRRESTISLSKNAISLLQKAASSEDGSILKMSFIGGKMIRAGGIRWVVMMQEKRQNGRQRWRSFCASG